MKKIFLICILFSVTAACDGDLNLFGDNNSTFGSETPIIIIDTNNGQIPRDDDDDVDVPDVEVCRFINPGITPLRRLTKIEYNNSIEDLFPNFVIPTQSVASDERVGLFLANTESAVDLVIAEKYMFAAEAVAGIAISDRTALCNGVCNVSWALAITERAFRRPLSVEESGAITGLFEGSEAAYGNEVAVRMTIEAILQSSSFLYRAELGQEPAENVTKLTPHELASRMSYFLGGTTPDAALLEAVKSGKLEKIEDIEKQARRLLAHPRGRARINSVITTWFGIDHVEDLERDGLTQQQLESLLAESQLFIESVMVDGDASLSELLTADYAIVSEENADLYGVSVSGVERVQLPPERRGMLGQPSFLAAHGTGQSIIHRGKFIKDAFLCLGTPDPPQALVPLPTFDGESDRSKADKRIEATDEGCATCHAVVDGIGKIFDPFDENGKYRTADTFGNTLTSTGQMLGTDIEGEIDGVSQLADAMVKSEHVRSCVTKQFLTYSLGRQVSKSEDACSLLVMKKALDLSNGNLNEMLIEIVKTDAFRYRRKLDTGAQ